MFFLVIFGMSSYERWGHRYQSFLSLLRLIGSVFKGSPFITIPNSFFPYYRREDLYSLLRGCSEGFCSLSRLWSCSASLHLSSLYTLSLPYLSWSTHACPTIGDYSAAPMVAFATLLLSLLRQSSLFSSVDNFHFAIFTSFYWLWCLRFHFRWLCLNLDTHSATHLSSSELFLELSIMFSASNSYRIFYSYEFKDVFHILSSESLFPSSCSFFFLAFRLVRVI